MTQNLLYTDIEDQLRASVRDLLSDRAQPASILARCDMRSSALTQ